MAQGALQHGLFAEDIAGDERDCQQHIENARLPDDEAIVMDVESEATEHQYQCGGGQQHAANLAMAEILPSDLRHRGNNEHGRGGVDSEPLEGGEEQKDGNEIVECLHPLMIPTS